MIIQLHQLLNSGSKAMGVNGSVSNKTFSWSPGVGNSAALIGLSVVLKDEGTTSFDKFGAITALTNGLLIQITQDGVTRTITTIKDNADLCNMFPWSQFGNGSILSILGIGTPQGFGASNNVFVGSLESDPAFTIVLNDSDTVQAVVQDNLSAIDILQMTVKVHVD